jgi:hypothetical protein
MHARSCSFWHPSAATPASRSVPRGSDASWRTLSWGACHRLAIGAAPGATLPLLAALARQWRATVDAGHGREDVSVARLGLANQS